MQGYAPEMTALRRDIHQHPELGFEERRTSDIVARCLTDWGYEVERGLGGTGVVGRLRCGTGSRAIGLRADMDALPIQEASGLPWASAHAGVMHACGHDGHTATLLGAAHYLGDTRGFSGTLNLIFQPAEEGLGGALRMMQDGLFEKYPCDAVFALHNMPGLPQGQLVFRSGAFMASSDYATIRLRGVGGHGAMPHRATDPVVAAASIVMALQTLVSRNVDPGEMAVVTVGAIHGGQANNVIPDSVTLELSLRALNPQVRALLEQRLRALVEAQAQSYGVQAELDYRHGYAVLVNAEAPTRLATEVARELFGAERVTPQGAPLSGSEDFAFMLERVPGCYLLVGNGQGEGSCMVHNPGYDYNDAILPTGAALWAGLVQRFLPLNDAATPATA
ncbi:M20 aminoacylase family protein [Ramlibacter sp. 2FC]|uniref:M20 aminoacylase family protein n=1 Tax=Ramlibacter sp. 2FC TaxID=2502188 RepID=UPI0010F51042|nr:M20 aminoacylase family protein [Ramlibacter sp. 2FC]